MQFVPLSLPFELTFKVLIWFNLTHPVHPWYSDERINEVARNINNTEDWLPSNFENFFR